MSENNNIPNAEEIDFTDVEAAREFFLKDRYATDVTGIDILEVDRDYAKCVLNIDERHLNAQGFLMGAVLFTMADFTFAVSTNFRRPVTVTLNANISFLSGTKGKTLYSESRLIKDGRRNCFFEVMITDDLGTKVAVINITGAHVG